MSCIPGAFAFPSERNHGNADLALERSGFRVALGVFREVLKARTGIELQSAGGQPLPQQRGPCIAHLIASPLESKDRILAARNGGLQGLSDRHKIRRRFGAGVVPALLGRGDARVIVADVSAAARIPLRLAGLKTVRKSRVGTGTVACAAQQWLSLDLPSDGPLAPLVAGCLERLATTWKKISEIEGAEENAPTNAGFQTGQIARLSERR